MEQQIFLSLLSKNGRPWFLYDLSVESDRFQCTSIVTKNRSEFWTDNNVISFLYTLFMKRNERWYYLLYLFTILLLIFFWEIIVFNNFVLKSKYNTTELNNNVQNTVVPTQDHWSTEYRIFLLISQSSFWLVRLWLIKEQDI